MDQFTLKARQPPFLPVSALRPGPIANIDLPASFFHKHRLEKPAKDIHNFLASDLHTPRLDALHNHLWLAGLMQPARELHRQRLLGRAIYITERPEEHIVWREDSVFVKALPDYILCHEFWTTSICPHADLYSSALGLLWSYTWLVRSKPDLKIAHEMGLVPLDIDWASWSRFVQDILDGDQNQIWCDVSLRYTYGELRLSRLNTLYRLGFAGLSLGNVVRGYMKGSHRYSTLFERNFGWLLSVFVYITVVLSGMQVALATGWFADDYGFQGLCYVVAIAAIALVPAVMLVMFLVWAGLFFYYVLSTILYHKKVRTERGMDGAS